MNTEQIYVWGFTKSLFTLEFFSSYNKRHYPSSSVLISSWKLSFCAVPQACTYVFTRVCVCVCVCAHVQAHTHSFVTHLLVSKKSLNFSFLCLSAWSPCTRNSDSEHCLPLESSPSQRFPGQTPLCNKLFSKDPGSLSLLMSFSGQDTTTPLHKEHSVPILM